MKTPHVPPFLQCPIDLRSSLYYSFQFHFFPVHFLSFSLSIFFTCIPFTYFAHMHMQLYMPLAVHRIHIQFFSNVVSSSPFPSSFRVAIPHTHVQVAFLPMLIVCYKFPISFFSLNFFYLCASFFRVAIHLLYARARHSCGSITCASAYVSTPIVSQLFPRSFFRYPFLLIHSHWMSSSIHPLLILFVWQLYISHGYFEQSDGDLCR